MELINWTIKHWPELAAAFGVGGGSGILSKKIIDRKQDAKLNSLEDMVKRIDKDMDKVKSEVVTNTLFDKQFREQTEKDNLRLREDIKEVKDSLNRILNHILTLK